MLDVAQKIKKGEWIEKDIGTIKIQIFEEAARTAFKQDHTLCIFKKRCGGVPVIEQNGDFYPCDHYVDPENRLGNISQQTLVELLDHPAQKAFGNAKELSLPFFPEGLSGWANSYVSGRLVIV